MKRIKLHILLTVMAMTLASLLLSCVDDELRYYGPDGIPEGNTQVTLNLDFTPFEEADLTRATEAPAGNAMRDVTDLCILVYDKAGNLVKEVENEAGEVVERFPKEIKGYKVEFVDRNSSDDSNPANKNAESQTAHIANVRLTLSYGIYYIYAVANLGDYSKGADGSVLTNVSTYQKLTGTGKYADKIGTVDGLLSMKVGWVADNIVDNREMLGMFTLDSERHVPSYSTTHATVRIDRDNTVLHTWLRRCASKVTVDFDGTGLRENVKVYIHSVRVVDIADKCTLGFGDIPDGSSTNGKIKFNNFVSVAESSDDNTVGLTSSVHHIDYGEGTDFKNWPCIAKGSPYIVGEDKQKIDFHHENAYALFFYENMQGKAPYGKIPVADLDNGNVAGQGPEGEKIEKDGVPLGTYIEVSGVYLSNASGNSSSGHAIKYRFMLGKDVTENCDAERNYHYKLTLKLRGNGNDADWHIDYDEPSGFDVPNPWYVSYLYNHDAYLPFKYKCPEGKKVVKLRADIIENPWWAHVDGNHGAPSSDEKGAYDETLNRGNYNGFLSLRQTEDVVITLEKAGFDTWKGYKDENANANETYYTNGNRGWREYTFDNSDETNVGREAYSYQLDGNKMSFSIPLFTRAKVMIKQSGYTGNNPYVGYERHAKVKLTVTFDDNTEDSTTVDVIQVRRLLNPKGVYRRSGNNEDFHVTLMELDGDYADNFHSFKSDGPWMAEIIGDKNFITLDGKQVVYGSTESLVDFTIKFNKTNRDEKIRNAVIRVRYHNYTCIHLIFVRQGYNAMQLSRNAKCGDIDKALKDKNSYAVKEETPVFWKTFNLIHKDKEAIDPRDEGSLFRYGNVDQPIDVVNNIYNESCKMPLAEDFKDQGPFSLAKSDGTHTGDTKTPWTEIKVKGSFTENNVATVRDIEQLYLSDHYEFGYGVLYADGATTTQEAVNDAYGYCRHDAAPNGNSIRGMRGLFVYYWNPSDLSDPDNARNIFFPIGRSGYGHRKEGTYTNWKGETNEPASNASKGVLRYCAMRYKNEPDFASSAPLFYALFKRPGAIYYIKSPMSAVGWDGILSENGSSAFGLDVNFFTFDVNCIVGSNVQSGKDACFVRCVGGD